jgi:hypothetical protein
MRESSGITEIFHKFRRRFFVLAGQGLSRLGAGKGLLARAVRSRSYVTHGQLGFNGEFGNQLFQIAAVLGYAERHGVRPILPRWICNASQRDFGHLYPGVPQVPAFRSWTHLSEQPRANVDLPFSYNVSLSGYFQCDRYFPSDAPESLRRLFLAPAEIPPLVDAFLATHGLTAFTAVHLRFYNRPIWDEDSLFLESLPEAYYLNALAQTAPDAPIVLVSHHPERAAAFAKRCLAGRRVILTSHADSLVDFYLLQRARHLVISNSTFSWWAAYLSRRAERILAPHRDRWNNRPLPENDNNPIAPYPARFAEVDF